MAAAKKKTASKSKTTKTNEPQDEYAAQPEASATATDAGEPPVVASGPTLADAAASYLAGLDADGAGDGTISSYGAELRMAAKFLGENTLLVDLPVERVREYFESDVVMKTRTGKRKAQPTYLKSQRVLRLCLLWAADKGMIATAPIPTLAKQAV